MWQGADSVEEVAKAFGLTRGAARARGKTLSKRGVKIKDLRNRVGWTGPLDKDSLNRLADSLNGHK